MKTTIKKTAATLLAILLAIQAMPVLAGIYASNEVQTESQMQEVLRIINESGPSVLKGQTLQLFLPDGYENVVWSSSNEDVATVDQDGLVTAVDVGKTTITVKAGSDESSTVIKVVAPAEKKADNGKVSLTILVNGDKVKVPYDGKPHEITYSYTSDDNDHFVASKVKMKTEAPSRTIAGAFKGTLTENDFYYDDDTVDATFIVNDGSIWITPITATVKADDVTVSLDEVENLDPTATVQGLLKGDEIDYGFMLPDIDGAGEYELTVYGEKAQGGYSVKFEAGTLTVTESESQAMITAPLYNLAKVGNTWYRLRKTTFKVDKPVSEYLKGVVDTGTNVPLDPENYEAANYDFANEILEYKGKHYAYITRRNETGLNIDGYYTATLNTTETLTAVKNKIGAGDAKTNKGNWLIAEEHRYDDPYATDSFHRNYTIVFRDIATFEQQTLYNMLAIGTATDYYKLRATTIKAFPAKDQTTGAAVNPDDYELEPYDFSNLVLEVDDVKYVYSSDGQEDEYTSYYTVELENVKKEVRFNNKSGWFTDTTKWLDGASKELLGVTSNDTMGYHANYRATLHKGEERTKSVTISSDWPEGKIAYAGAKITLSAALEGFGENVKLQWQRSKDNENWEDIAGETGMTYTYTLDDTTVQYVWRVIAED